jgi:fumarate hydratase class I
MKTHESVYLPKIYSFYQSGKITEEGVFLEQLETDVSKYIPEVTDADVSGESVDININMPMSELRSLLSQYPVTTRLNLTGTLVVARDQAHAKILERVDSGEGNYLCGLVQLWFESF